MRSTGGLYPQSMSKAIRVQLSASEQHRFLRSLCRFQAYSNLFGTSESWRGHFDGSEVCDLFFAIMKPWEMEEFTCVHDYLTKFYWHQLQEMLHISREEFDDAVWEHSDAYEDCCSSGEPLCCFMLDILPISC